MSWSLLDQNEKKYEFDWATRDQHEQMCEALQLSVLDNHEHQISWRYSTSESQKPRQRVSNADRKVFVNPESFWDMLIIG